MVQRYELGGYPADVWLNEDEKGDLVEYEDYKKLEQENKNMRELLISKDDLIVRKMRIITQLKEDNENR